MWNDFSSVSLSYHDHTDSHKMKTTPASTSSTGNTTPFIATESSLTTAGKTPSSTVWKGTCFAWVRVRCCYMTCAANAVALFWYRWDWAGCFEVWFSTGGAFQRRCDGCCSVVWWLCRASSWFGSFAGNFVESPFRTGICFWFLTCFLVFVLWCRIRGWCDLRIGYRHLSQHYLYSQCQLSSPNYL